MALLTDEHRRWIGHEDAPVTVEVSRRDIVKYALATEQREPRFLRGDEAPPMFVFNLFGPLRPLEELRADGLPRGQGGGPAMPLKRVMAGGTELRVARPIRPGDTLTATTRLTDLYEKSGAQGPLIFSVRTTRIVDASGALVLEEVQTAIAR